MTTNDTDNKTLAKYKYESPVFYKLASSARSILPKIIYIMIGTIVQVVEKKTHTQKQCNKKLLINSSIFDKYPYTKFKSMT